MNFYPTLAWATPAPQETGIAEAAMEKGIKKASCGYLLFRSLKQSCVYKGRTHYQVLPLAFTTSIISENSYISTGQTVSQSSAKSGKKLGGSTDFVGEESKE